MIRGRSFLQVFAQKRLLSTILPRSVEVIQRVTTKDIMGFAELTGDHNEVHIKKNIVHGMLLQGYVSAVLGTRLPGHGTMVVSQTVQFLNPCFAETDVKIIVEILSERKIIECAFRCVNNVNENDVFLKGTARLMRPKKGN